VKDVARRFRFREQKLKNEYHVTVLPRYLAIGFSRFTRLETKEF